MKEDLVKLAQQGDNEAFYKLISDDSEKLYNIAYCYFKNQMDSLEAVQEITCRSYVKLKKLKDPKFFSTWLTKILINYCIDEQKRKRKHVQIEEINSAFVSLSEENIDTILLETAINELEPKYKKIIILKYFQDMTIEEISRVLKCPEGTVKTWTHRALTQLRVLVNKESDFNV